MGGQTRQHRIIRERGCWLNQQHDPAPLATSPDEETLVAPREKELHASGLGAGPQPRTVHKQGISFLISMTNESSRSEELSTESKVATGMDKALVASRHQARDLHSGLKVHAKLGSHTGPLVVPGFPQVKWSGRMKSQNMKQKRLREIEGLLQKEPTGDPSQP